MIPQKSPSFNGPRFAQCMILAERNIARARVLEQIFYYTRNCWVPIGKQRYCAPSTDRLVWELGLSKRAVYNAISALKRAGVIETKHRRIKGSKRRCMRLLKNPCNQDIGPEPGKEYEVDGQVHTETHTSHTRVPGLHSDGASSAPIGCTEEHLPNKKKKETNKTHGPEADHAPETGQPPETGSCDPAETLSGEAALLTSTPQSPPPPEATVYMTTGMKLHAFGVRNRLAERKGWDNHQSNRFFEWFKDWQIRARTRELRARRQSQSARLS